MQMVVEAESLGQSAIEVTVEELCMLGRALQAMPRSEEARRLAERVEALWAEALHERVVRRCRESR